MFLPLVPAIQLLEIYSMGIAPYTNMVITTSFPCFSDSIDKPMGLIIAAFEGREKRQVS